MYQFRRRWLQMPIPQAIISVWNMKSQSFFSCLLDASYFLSETSCTSSCSRSTAIKISLRNARLSHPTTFPWKATQTSTLFKAARDFCLAFEDTLLSISPKLRLKHNQCLPTRLRNTSCLVTTSPLLSTTERLTNSMSVLNLETPLIYPPHWIDRRWLHRRSLSRTVACLIFNLSTVFLHWNQKLPAVRNRYSPIKSEPS